MRSWFRHQSRRRRLTTFVVFAVLAAVASRELMALQHEFRHHENLREREAAEADAFAADLEFTVEALLEANAHDGIRRVVQRKSLLEHVEAIAVVDENGAVIASSNALEGGWHASSTRFAPVAHLFAEVSETRAQRELRFTVDAQTRVATLVPVEGGQYGTERPPAVAVVIRDVSWVEAATAYGTRQTIVWGAIAMLLTVAALGLILQFFAIRPIERLRAALHRASQTGEPLDLSGLRSRELVEIGEVMHSVLARLRTQTSRLEDLALVAERTNNAVIITDADGRIEWVNEAFTDISGFTAAEAAGRKPGTLLQGEGTDPKTIEFIRSRLAKGVGFQTEILNYTKGGTPYWISMDIQPIHDAEGNVIKYIAVEEDITTRRQTEQKLQRISDLFEMTSDISGVGGWELNLVTNELIWTAETKRIHGVSRDYIPDLDDALAFYPEGDREVVSDAVQKAIRTGEDFDLETQFLTAGGDKIWVHSRGRAVFESGRAVRIVGSFQNITAKKHAERERQAMLEEVERSRDEAEQTAERLAEKAAELDLARDEADRANAAKSEFLANMSHEIRTPMTSILGFADLLGEADTAQRESHITTIKRNGEHLLAIINDILDISKIEAGKMTVESIECSPVQIVEDVVEFMRVRAVGKSITLSSVYESAVPEFIASDPIRLRQILINLIGNAIKFTEVGSVTVCVGTERDDHGEPSLVLRVRDTGIGIDEESLTRLFQSFSQADNSMTRRFGGTGLGLQISQRLAELLGGGITVDSKPGVGTVFTVRIATGDLNDVPMLTPAEVSVRLEQAASAAPVAYATPEPDDNTRPLEGLRVLLVEDGPDNQRLITHHLKKAGATVEVAENGQVGLDRIDQATEPFDVVFMDMQMPVLDGYRATSILRERGCTIPIIALTAHAMPGDRARCLDSGCDEFLTKPIDRAQLVRTCRLAADDAMPKRRAA
jgi:PAS domain S-box-containing protein